MKVLNIKAILGFILVTASSGAWADDEARCQSQYAAAKVGVESIANGTIATPGGESTKAIAKNKLLKAENHAQAGEFCEAYNALLASQ